MPFFAWPFLISRKPFHDQIYNYSLIVAPNFLLSSKSEGILFDDNFTRYMDPWKERNLYLRRIGRQLSVIFKSEIAKLSEQELRLEHRPFFHLWGLVFKDALEENFEIDEKHIQKAHDFLMNIWHSQFYVPSTSIISAKAMRFYNNELAKKAKIVIL